jgi:hypothetical protein
MDPRERLELITALGALDAVQAWRAKGGR